MFFYMIHDYVTMTVIYDVTLVKFTNGGLRFSLFYFSFLFSFYFLFFYF